MRLNVEDWPTDRLIEYASNPRRNDHAVDKVAAAIHAFGFRVPILAKSDGLIVDGHLRLKAAKKLNLETVPVILADDMSDLDIRAFRISVNKMADLAEWDDELLALELGALKDDGLDLDLLGFDQTEIDGFLDFPTDPATEGDTEPQIDRADELREQWGVETGQVWKLGEHRLLCGDSTKAEDMELVMGGDLASLVVTDPPYGVSYAEKNAFLNACDEGNRIQTEIVNDHMDKEQTQAMWKDAFTEMGKAMDKGAVVYCFMPQGGDQMMMMMMMMMDGAGIEPRHELIWLKNNHVLGRTDYAYKHEPILYAWKPGGHKFYGGFQTSILEFARPQKSYLHPTMKPITLIEHLVGNSSKAGEVLYEPFSGSGTTIIACENLGRKCRAIEISPAYVAVAIQRWADHTGKTPEKVSGP